MISKGYVIYFLWIGGFDFSVILCAERRKRYGSYTELLTKTCLGEWAAEISINLDTMAKNGSNFGGRSAENM